MIKVASLFDGIGGTLLSAAMCGIEPVWASEIEPFPIKVTIPNILFAIQKCVEMMRCEV